MQLLALSLAETAHYKVHVITGLGFRVNMRDHALNIFGSFFGQCILEVNNVSQIISTSIRCTICILCRKHNCIIACTKL